MTGAGTKASKVRVLDRISYTFYPIQFHKDKSKDVLTLLNSTSELNAMTPAYPTHLGLKMRVTNVGTKTNNEFSLATYGIVIAAF